MFDEAILVPQKLVGGPSVGNETPRSDFAKKRKHRSKLAMDMVMSCLESIETIRDSFNCIGDVNLYDFIKILRSNLKWDQMKVGEQELIQALVDLFQGMDLKSDGRLRFDDFLATIISTGTEGSDLNVVNPIPSYVPGPSLRVPSRIDKFVHYLSGPDRVLMIEKNTFRLYDGASMAEKPAKTFNSVSGDILAVDYIPPMSAPAFPFDMLALATTQAISIWENVSVAGVQAALNCGYNPGGAIGNGQSSISKLGLVHRCNFITRSPQTAIKWSPQHNQLYSGAMNGEVSCWRVDSSERVALLKTPPTDDGLAGIGHSDVVTTIESIPRLDVLVTGSFDVSIRLWDLVHGVERKKLIGHRKGITSLSYSDEYRFLLSGSFDHDLCIWSPFADKLVYRLAGHPVPIVAGLFLENTPQIVSVDQDGWVKVWDVRNFQCIHTFPSIPDVCSFAVVPTHRKLVISSHKNVVTFDQEPSNPDFGLSTRNTVSTTQKSSSGITALGPPRNTAASSTKPGSLSSITDGDLSRTTLAVTGLVYNPMQLSFATSAARDIKIWNAMNGHLQRVYRDVAEDDISALCIDDRYRKLFIGDRKGNIIVVNYSTCVFIRRLCSHKGEICALSYCAEDRVLLSTGWDGYTAVHDDRSLDDEKQPKFRLKIRHPASSFQNSTMIVPHLISSLASSDVIGLTGQGAMSPSSPGQGTVLSVGSSLQADREQKLLLASLSMHHATLAKTRIYGDTQTELGMGRSTASQLGVLAKRFALSESDVRQLQRRANQDDGVKEDERHVDGFAPLLEEFERNAARGSLGMTAGNPVDVLDRNEPCVSVSSVLLSLVAMAVADTISTNLHPISPSASPGRSSPSSSSPITITNPAPYTASVQLFDLESGRSEGICLVRRPQPALEFDLKGESGVDGLLDVRYQHTTINALLFLTPLPFLAAADEDGWVTVFFTRPSPYRGQQAFSFHNENTRGDSCVVTCLAFDPNTNTLFTGDILGVVKGWSLAATIISIGETAVELRVYPDPRVIVSSTTASIRTLSAIASSVGVALNGTRTVKKDMRRQPQLEEIQRHRLATLLRLNAIAMASALASSTVPIPLQFTSSNHDSLRFAPLGLAPVQLHLVLGVGSQSSGNTGAGQVKAVPIRSLSFLPKPLAVVVVTGDTVMFWHPTTGKAIGGLSWNKDSLYDASTTNLSLSSPESVVAAVDTDLASINLASGTGVSGTEGIAVTAATTWVSDISRVRWMLDIDVENRQNTDARLTGDLLRVLDSKQPLQSLEKHGIDITERQGRRKPAEIALATALRPKLNISQSTPVLGTAGTLRVPGSGPGMTGGGSFNKFGPRATLGAAVNAADAYVDSLLNAHPLFGGFEGRPDGLSERSGVGSRPVSAADPAIDHARSRPTSVNRLVAETLLAADACLLSVNSSNAETPLARPSVVKLGGSNGALLTPLRPSLSSVGLSTVSGRPSSGSVDRLGRLGVSTLSLGASTNHLRISPPGSQKPSAKFNAMRDQFMQRVQQRQNDNAFSVATVTSSPSNSAPGVPSASLRGSASAVTLLPLIYEGTARLNGSASVSSLSSGVALESSTSSFLQRNAIGGLPKVAGLDKRLMRKMQPGQLNAAVRLNDFMQGLQRYQQH